MLGGITLCDSALQTYCHCCICVSAECVVQMAELTEENSLLRKQLDGAQHEHVAAGDKEPAGKVDKNANLQMMHSTSDELLASEAKQLQNNEADEQQVVILF